MHPPAVEELSYGELRELTKLPDEDLTRCLASLTLSKYKLLVKVGLEAGLPSLPPEHGTVLPLASADDARSHELTSLTSSPAPQFSPPLWPSGN